MNEAIVRVHNLTKVFFQASSLGYLFGNRREKLSPTVALRDISFFLRKGQTLGILGPNGSGKTTLLKIFATLILPDKGEVEISGHTLGRQDEAIKSIVGLAGSEERNLYWRLSGMQNLEFCAGLYGLNRLFSKQRISQLLSLFEIDYAQKRVDSYSSGMKRKIALAMALIHDPQILLLDEPTKSLDYNISCQLRAFIKKQADQGKTVVLATHNMDEAEMLCDIVMILNQGKIAAFGYIPELKARFSSSDCELSDIYSMLTRHV